MNIATRDPSQLRDALFVQLPPAVRDAVAATIAQRGGVYAVGGAVRDLLLGRPVRDLDLATERDAIEIARASLTTARITEHKRFRTVSATIAGTRIDLATCRTETYARPGALPSVQPATIDDDLRRRDFTVNALALRLSGEPALLDPTGGVRDLRDGIIRVMHEASFRDDATRIFRAFRYAARLGLSIEPQTMVWLHRDVAHLAAVSPARVRREIELMFAEPAETASQALASSADGGALAAVHPALSWDAACADGFAPPLLDAVPRLPFGFALVAHRADGEAAARIAGRLRLNRAEAAAVAAMPSLRALTPTLRRPGAKPSGVAVVLDRFPPAAVAAYAATEPGAIAARLALRYLEAWRHERPILRGHDLLDLGIPEGPRVEQGLQLVRAARLDGWASDRDDERALMMRFAKSIRESGAPRGEITRNGSHD